MFKWLRKILDQLHKNTIINRDGCILYCKNCHSILNGKGNNNIEGLYIAKCNCGSISTFLLDSPVPILIKNQI
jgi:hypothetical protein